MAQIGTIKIQTQNGERTVPVFDLGDSGSNIYEYLRVRTPSGTGFIPLASLNDAAFSEIRTETQSGTLAVHKEATLNQIITNGLISRWKFENDANDSYGSNNGSESGVSYSTDSQQGSYSVNFDGSDDISITDDSSIDFGSSASFTWVYWLKSTDTNSTLSHVAKGSGGTHYELGYHGSANGFRVKLDDGGSAIKLDDGGSSWFDGNWHHCAVTYDSNNGAEIYYDGSATASTGTTVGSLSNGSSLYFGYNAGNGSNWDGQMDDCRVYNRVLSSSEISDIYNGNG
jgi:hypothetical protein